MILNYKSIPYKTQWIEYPSLAPTFNALGIPPNTSGGTPYTSPAVRIGSDQYVMDSRPIATELETLYPTPPLHLDSPILSQVEKILPAAHEALRGVWMPQVPRNLLNPISAEYFERTREERFGMPLSQLEREKGGDEAWVKAAPVLEEVGGLLRKNGGPFFLGEEGEFYFSIIRKLNEGRAD